MEDGPRRRRRRRLGRMAMAIAMMAGDGRRHIAVPLKLLSEPYASPFF